MTQEEKQLLLITLCGMLPYGAKINIRNDYTFSMEDVELNAYHLASASYYIEYGGLRPYLRPISSMTEKEKRKYRLAQNAVYHDTYVAYSCSLESIDWLNAHHFDYRGLIEKGLALEAPEDMYKIE